jgi:FADH2 O2-dependent halogenase
MVGENWAILPSSAMFVDPLHSTGIAQTLCGIERLMPIFNKPANEQTHLFQAYANETMHEVDLLDKLIHGCYQCFDDFDLFSHFAMLYFAGADFMERQRRIGKRTGFLNSGDHAYCKMVDRLYNQLIDGTIQVSDFQGEIEPWNMVGLCDPNKQNMYDYA